MSSDGVLRSRPALRAGEAVFSAGLICPDVLTALSGLGLQLGDLTEVNFVTRAAPMGAVASEVVVAAFFNFNPDAITPVVAGVWDVASPEVVLAAQAAAFSAPLAAALSSIAPDELAELAALSRSAADAVAGNGEGRPLFAGLLSQPWPTGDHLVVWHAGKLLREHRGDGHVALLVAEGLTGIEALALHEAFEPKLPRGLLQAMRRWGDDAWGDAVAGLRSRGWLTDDPTPTLSDDGRRRRQSIEDRTDALAARAFEAMGPDGIARMGELGGTVARAVRAAGLGLGTDLGRWGVSAPRVA